MYNIYVSNKSSVSVFVRLHPKKISDLNDNFHQELDRLTRGAEGDRGDEDSTQTRSNVSSFLARWSFCMIPKGGTAPFVVEDMNDSTRMYASLYSKRRLWHVDYQVLSVKYGCLIVKSHEVNPISSFWLHPSMSTLHSSSQDLVPIYFSQINPEPQWILRKKGDNVNTAAFIRTGEGDTYFGRLSVDHVPCKVTSIPGNRCTQHDQLHTWEAPDGSKQQCGELLLDSGHEFFRAKMGDQMPPHAVILGVNDSGEPNYLGRIGGSIPCSVTSEDDKVGYFNYFAGVPKRAERGEIMVLTGHGSKCLWY